MLRVAVETTVRPYLHGRLPGSLFVGRYPDLAQNGCELLVLTPLPPQLPQRDCREGKVSVEQTKEQTYAFRCLQRFSRRTKRRGGQQPWLQKQQFPQMTERNSNFICCRSDQNRAPAECFMKVTRRRLCKHPHKSVLCVARKSWGKKCGADRGDRTACSNGARASGFRPGRTMVT